MKRIIYLLLFISLLFFITTYKVKACVKSLDVRGSTYRVQGHQNMWLPNGSFSYEGSLPSSSCFHISSSDIVTVRVSGSNFQFQPHKFGNADITVSVDKSCLCDGISSLSKTVHFMLSEWGLRNLEVVGYQISPAFYNGTMDYTLTVPNNVDEITIKAAANYSTSKITGAGKRKLNVGTNKLVINVVTVEGDSRDYTITVTREKPVNPTSIKIKEKDLSLQVGETKELSYTLTPSNATATITWESSNQSIVSVDSKGKIKALSGGTATITIKANNLSDKINVTSIDKVKEIQTEDEITLYKGDKYQIKYTVLPENAINKQVTFESSDETLLKVSSDGLITTLDKTGNGNITITSVESGIKKTIKVTVKSKLEKIYFPNKYLELYIDDVKNLNIIIVPSDVKVTINYESSNPNVVTVNSGGIIKGISEGEATITAKTIDNEFSDIATIKVIKREEKKKEEPIKEDDSLYTILIILIVIVSLVILFLILSMSKKKKKRKRT